MKGKSTGAGLNQMVLTLCFIVLGASLDGAGVVGFWGMFAIMMVPNAGFLLLRILRRTPAS